MKIEEKLLRQIILDLGLNAPFVKGQNTPIKNCWHFSTDGKAVEIPARAREVCDVSGAGDTVIAVLAACIAGGMAEAFYGVPEDLKQECRKRLEPDMLLVLDRFQSMI